MKLIGTFSQIITLRNLPLKGSLKDEQLEIVENGGVLVQNGEIIAIGGFEDLYQTHPNAKVEEVQGDHVLLPGFIDCHTHICYGGNRAKDYALRIAGKTYLEIAQSGGGIWDSVTQTRLAKEEDLISSLITRANRHLSEGVTTIEVKSGYGLGVQEELKQLRVIANSAKQIKASLITTCLAAHLKPKDFDGNNNDYLSYLVADLLPILRKEKLSNRIDIFIEQSAFSTEEALFYLKEAKALGFDLTIHADQFTVGGSKIAVEMGAVSADHLEASGDDEIKLLAKSTTVSVALPGASLGLGMCYTPGRKLLDAGACLAIASDWNPGSAPMGDLLMQAAVFGASEKLSTAETLAALTFRAAKALNLNDTGILAKGKVADMQAYPTNDFRDILYFQGKLKPNMVWKDGQLI